MLNNWMAFADALICVAIAGRILLFSTKGLKHKRHISLIAYFMILFFGNFPILYLYGDRYIDDWPTLVSNMLICIAIYRARGNVASLLNLRSGNEQNC